MLRVFKYLVEIGNYFEVELPRSAQILTVDLQGSEIKLWALVDPKRPMIKRRFRLSGTGHPIEEDMENLKYINTFLVHEGAVVVHVFEVLG